MNPELGGPTPEEIEPRHEVEHFEGQLQLWRERYQGISKNIVEKAAPMLQGETVTADDLCLADSAIDEGIRDKINRGELKKAIEPGDDWSITFVRKQIAANICLEVPLRQTEMAEGLRDRIRDCFEGLVLWGLSKGYYKAANRRINSHISRMLKAANQGELLSIRQFVENSNSFCERMSGIITATERDSSLSQQLNIKYQEGTTMSGLGQYRLNQIGHCWTPYIS